MSRLASAAPRSRATVEKRANIGVSFPTLEKIFARVYLVMSFVTVKVPKPPAPFACIRRSGITSRSKCASFSRNQTSCRSAGPRGPAVSVFWLSTTGAPKAVVSLVMGDPFSNGFERYQAGRRAWITRAIRRARSRRSVGLKGQDLPPSRPKEYSLKRGSRTGRRLLGLGGGCGGRVEPFCQALRQAE